MKIKRDYVLLLLMIAVMAVTNCTTQDSRTFVKPGTPIVERTRKEIVKHTIDATYLVYDEPDKVIDEVEAPVSEEVVIDVEIEDVVEESHCVDDYSEEEIIENEISYTEPGLTYLGTYEITAYEYTGSTCANGNYPTPWYTVASNYFDFGTTLYIDGVGYVVVEDRGASWHGSDWLDLYIGDIDACYEWGRQYLDVYLVG